MADGFSAVKEMHLDRFADVFAAAGLGALAFDNRNFGASVQKPAQLRHNGFLSPVVVSALVHVAPKPIINAVCRRRQRLSMHRRDCVSGPMMASAMRLW